MSEIEEVRHMRRALELAEQGWGQVAPNPLVGAVVVKDGEVVGEGYHARWGGPHAEVEALSAAGESSRGATLYVNLEPCGHTGKTGPCTVAIERSGVARVVVGSEDPNPVATGGGEWLRARGIEVVTGVCEREARELNAAHLTYSSLGRPHVALKYALSLDARLSEAEGVETRLTGEAAQVEAHRLRAGYDAVMVGIGTVLADDPRLTVRLWHAPRRPPVRIVLDSRLRLPLDSHLARTAEDAPVWVFAGPEAPEAREKALRERGVDVVRVFASPSGQGLELPEMIKVLARREVRCVLCEGGGKLGSSLLTAGLVDRLYLFMAPIVLGSDAVPAFRGTPARREWELVARRELGPDTLHVLSAGVPGVEGERR